MGTLIHTLLKAFLASKPFWLEVGDHPALVNHPIKSVPGYQSRAVPLVLHGDGASDAAYWKCSKVLPLHQLSITGGESQQALLDGFLLDAHLRQEQCYAFEQEHLGTSVRFIHQDAGV